MGGRHHRVAEQFDPLRLVDGIQIAIDDQGDGGGHASDGIGVIGGEFIMSGSGLGYAIGYAYNNFDSETMYATMLFVLLVAIGMNSGLGAWERRIRRRRGLA